MIQRAQKPDNVVNGVNVDQLFDTVKAIKGNPTVAKFKFRARNEWLDGGHNRTTINDFSGACETHNRNKPFVFEADEPPILLGKDRGANPVEYVLHALAACLTTSIAYHAAAKGVEIHEIEARFEGDLDLRGFLGLREDVRNGYEAIRASFKIKASCPDEMLEEVCQWGPTYSPVYDIVTGNVPVTVELAKD